MVQMQVPVVQTQVPVVVQMQVPLIRMQVPVVWQLLLQLLPQGSLGIQVLQSHQQPMFKCKVRIEKWKMNIVFCVSFNRSCQDGQALEALPCGHSFHSDCLREWRRVAQIGDLHKCPLHPQSRTERGQLAAADDWQLDSGSD